MTRRLAATGLTLLLLFAGTVLAQQKATITGVPDIPFTSVPNFLKLPPGETLGESVAVATNSKGHIFVYHRRDTTRLFGRFRPQRVIDRAGGQGKFCGLGCLDRFLESEKQSLRVAPAGDGHEDPVLGGEHREVLDGLLHLPSAELLEVLGAEIGVMTREVDDRRSTAGTALHVNRPKSPVGSR